jgi:hypothetical protein
LQYLKVFAPEPEIETYILIYDINGISLPLKADYCLCGKTHRKNGEKARIWFYIIFNYICLEDLANGKRDPFD